MTYEQKLKRLAIISRIANKVKQERKQARAQMYANKRRQLEERGLL
jgi:uncharacterized membrane protein